MKVPLFFAHGNGFPSSCYRQMFRVLEESFSVAYIETIGHNPNYPVTDNWDYLVEELADTLKTYYNHPVIAVGHSLGGVLHFLASAKYPHLYQQVILLDSPILVGRIKSYAVRLLKQFGLIDRISPGIAATRGRIRRWHNADEAFTYFRTKPLFKGFTDECLFDYIHSGTVVTPKGLTLKFDPEIEYQIFQTFPHTMAQYNRQLRVPVHLIYGQDSNVITSYDLRSMQRKIPAFTAEATLGGHLFPFEFPVEAAGIIKKLTKISENFSQNIFLNTTN